MPTTASQLNSPDGWWLRSFDFQIIRLLLHLKFCEHQGDGVPRVRQDGPLTLPTAPQASSPSASASTRRVTAGEIKAGNEPAGAPQGAATRVLRCQSPKRETGRGRREVCLRLFQFFFKVQDEQNMAASAEHLKLSHQINVKRSKKSYSQAV